MRREFGGAVPKAATTAPLGGAPTDLTILCDDLTGWPPGDDPFFIILDRGKPNEEKVLIGARAGNIMSVWTDGIANGRAADGTAIASHVLGTIVEHVYTATDADEANAHVNMGEGAHGYPLLDDLVTVDGVQTLTNKTIDFEENELLNLPPSPPGAAGPSAYEVAVENGFVGTEEEWLASLEGEPGPPGDSLPDQTGNDGKFLTTDGTDPSWGPAMTPGVMSDVEFNWSAPGPTTYLSVAPHEIDAYAEEADGDWSEVYMVGGKAYLSGTELTQIGFNASGIVHFKSPEFMVNGVPTQFVPDQTGHGGEYLTTDGADLSFAPVAGGASALDDLTDVTAPSPSNNQALSWDAATSKWIPKTVSAGGSYLPLAGGTMLGELDVISAPTVPSVSARQIHISSVPPGPSDGADGDIWFSDGAVSSAPVAPSGLVVVAVIPFTALAAVPVDACFTSLYDNYLMHVRLTAATGTDVALTLRLRAAGVDILTGYTEQRVVGFGASVVSSLDLTGNDDWSYSLVTSAYANLFSGRSEIFSPALAQPTIIQSLIFTKNSTPNTYVEQHFGANTNAVAYDGLDLIVASGTITGTITIFGYRKTL